MKQNEIYEEMFEHKAQFWTGDMQVEQSALDQLRNISRLPILAGHIAVMPDVHMGMGATVGSVLPLNAAVIPAAVGVDIGCGMCAVKTSLRAEQLPDSLHDIRLQIERDVPVGFNCHNAEIPLYHEGLNGLRLEATRKNLLGKYSDLRIMKRVGQFNEKRMPLQLGTLGGGNHFIEVCLDTEGFVWVMLHSGSRNVGKTIGEVATDLAKAEVKKRHIELVDYDLAWFDEGSELFNEYVEGMNWAQEYARLSRDLMMLLTLKALQRHTPEFTLTQEAVNCHHNFLAKETHFGKSTWVTRKGAVSAQAGQLGIIPGSMGAKSFIVCGKGHEAAYCSCSHGAGRLMSRTRAKKEYTTEDVVLQTAGVECRKDSGVVDEIPAAYKDIDMVMEAQSDLVSVVATLKQVLCVKG